MQFRSEVIIFGAGATSKQVLEQLRAVGIKPVAFCDNNPLKLGHSIAGLPVISFTELCSVHSQAFIYISVQLYYREILQQLLAHGFSQENIAKHDLVVQLPWESDFRDYFIKSADAFNSLYNSLADDISRDVLVKRCAFLLSRCRSFLSDIHRPNQYFEREFITTGADEVFVDVGTFSGDTIEGYVRFCNGEYRHIFGFEPDSAIFQTASANLAGFSNVTLVPMGTANFSGVVSISSSLGLMQSIASETFDVSRERETFNVCCLDDYFEDAEMLPSFIKMDIEGAEMDTLVGSARIIKSKKPKIAVCVYHRKKDIIDIPNKLKEYEDSYKIYLRHYSDNSTETVLYAV